MTLNFDLLNLNMYHILRSVLQWFLPRLNSVKLSVPDL